MLHNTESLLVKTLRSNAPIDQWLLTDQQVSLYPSNLSSHPSLIPRSPPSLSSPLISFHSHIDSARWLSRNPFSPHPSLPIHQSFHIRYRSEDRVPNPSPDPPQPPIQVTIFPSFFPRLTSTRSMRWWTNNTDTWSYSICALGPGPKSIVISSPPRRREGDAVGEGGGRPGCWGITQQERTLWRAPKIGAASKGIRSKRTCFLVRVFPVRSLMYRAINSFRPVGEQKIASVKHTFPLPGNAPVLPATVQLPSSPASF